MADADITRLLRLAADGDGRALDEVAAWAYADLERLAASRMRRRYRGRVGDATLEPAALVNETFVRLLEHPVGFESRGHFLAFASRVMLSALADYERRRRARKRGGDRARITLTGLVDPNEEVRLGHFEEALQQLQALDPRKADVVRLRVLWGATLGEAARLLEVSVPTVERDWRFARLWLADRLGPSA